MLFGVRSDEYRDASGSNDPFGIQRPVERPRPRAAHTRVDRAAGGGVPRPLAGGSQVQDALAQGPPGAQQLPGREEKDSKKGQFASRVEAIASRNKATTFQKVTQLETPIARYKPGQKEKSGNSCCFQHIDHLFLGQHHHITGTPSQNDQGTIKT